MVLADHLGELGVAADALVDELVPAAGADRLACSGSPRVRILAGPAASSRAAMRWVSIMAASSTSTTHSARGWRCPVVAARQKASTVQPEVAGGAAGGLGGGGGYFNPSRLAKSPNGIPKGGVVALGVHGVGGDDHTGKVQAGKQRLELGDLIGCRAHLALGEHGPVVVVQRSQQVDLVA
jgi:hypothetical protein